MKKNLLALGIGTLLALTILEIFLRIYQPFEFRIKANKIILPINKEYAIKNTGFRGVDPVIIHKKNSIGFRGEPPPPDLSSHLSVITVGGSTTECFYISDQKTWPDLLGKMLGRKFKKVWINNAGLEGHSTFGHIVLMEDYIAPMKPKVVLFLVGINDIQLETFGVYDNWNISGRINTHSIKGRLVSLANYSECLGVALNLYRNHLAKKRGLPHVIDWDSKPRYVAMPEELRKQKLEFNRDHYLKPYGERLARLIEISQKNKILPVFITQPVLYGNVIDDLTKVDLGKLDAGDHETNGAFQWELLEMYNDVTRQAAKKGNVLLIDLGREMPKSSRYYYDFKHYVNGGCEKVAEIIDRRLSPYMAKHFPEFKAD